MNTKTCRASDAVSRKCSNCFFSAPGLIPDPFAKWEPGMGQKPRIAGFRCHATRPAAGGFPPVETDSFCAYFTDRATLEQPLRHLVTEGGAVWPTKH